MEHTDRLIGKMLDNRYEILEVIGVGGMAYVYKARCHLLNRMVAVKILKENYAKDADFRRRFHAESQAVAMLGHPNIVAVYDVSRSSALEYIVMELIDGITLKQYMSKKGVLTWREGLHFVTQIVKALSHAHAKGIIHRDIKPHNIMILRDGSVKVADFGIARFASKQNTLTQEALGSVHYISPEQARGSHIDPCSDLYSVGVVLYEMLTGRLPFEGDSAVSVAIQHINSLPLQPREINPDIPVALEIITVKAMAPQLSKRYGSAEEMLRDLEEFRKNPAIVFAYDMDDLQTMADGDSAAESLAVDLPAARPGRKKPQKNSDPDQDHKTRKSNNMIAILLVVFFVLALIAALGFYINGIASTLFAPGGANMIEVPNLRGMTFSEELRAEHARYFEIVPEFEHRAQYDLDTIFDQNPRGNTQAPEGSTLTLHVSMGALSFVLEDYRGQDEREVAMTLRSPELGLVIGEIERVENRDHPSGHIISTDPAAGTMVTKGQTINLVVSLGPEAEDRVVPDLRGLGVQEARDTLAFHNLTLGGETHVESDLPAGTVVQQSIEAGETVPEHTQIDISISEGPHQDDPDDPGGGEPGEPPANGTDPDPPEDTPIQVTARIMVPEEYRNVRFYLRIEVDGAEVYNDTVRTRRSSLTRTLAGLPSAQVSVFFDDLLMETRTIDYWR